MNSSTAGADISSSKVTNVELMGFWVSVDEQVFFVRFDDYPAFKRATVEQIFNLQTQGPGQLHWPDLDIDIEIEALEFPEKYPLIYR